MQADLVRHTTNAVDQKMIDDMKDDLMTVLESFMDELATEELFYNAIKFITLALYECSDNHKQAFKIMRLAIDDAIRIHVENKKEH